MTNNDHKDPLSYWQSRALEAEQEKDQWRAQAEAEAIVCGSYRDERDELAAMVGRLRDSIIAIGDAPTLGESENALTEAEKIATETPPTALRHLKADTLEREATLMESAEQLSANGAFDMRQVALRLRERARQYRDGEIE